MIERINNLASFMNVTAAESKLAAHLFDIFFKKGLKAEIDRNGCVIVRIAGTGKTKKKVMICTPIDIPGFICLYREGATSYLTKTCKTTEINKKNKTVLDQSGHSFPVKESVYDKNEFCIDFPDGKIGDVFRSLPKFEKDEAYIFGKHAARYLLIDLLMNLVNETPKNDVLLCFTTSFHSLSASEANVAYREKPDTVLMLGFSEDDEKMPLLFIKNGKNFAPDHLLQKMKNISSQLGVSLKEKVTEQEISKEFSVISAYFTEVVSLGLPYQKDDDFDEKVHFGAIEDLGKILTKFFIAE